MSTYALFQYDFGKTLGTPVFNTPVQGAGEIVYPQRFRVPSGGDRSSTPGTQAPVRPPRR